MSTKVEYTAQDRAKMFMSATRQNLQMLPKETVNSGATTMQFKFPKSRYLSMAYVKVAGKIKVKHASNTTIKGNELTPYKLIRRISIDLNNGFAPYVLTGEQLALYNAVDKNAKKMFEVSNYKNTPDDYEYSASATGEENVIDFTVQLPITLAPNSPVGIILLQNDQTNVTMNIDIANGIDMFNDVNTTGYTVDVVEAVGQVCLETFSVPANEIATPNLSVLKLVNGRSDSMASTGQQIIKLSTGTIYRKLILQIVDENGVAVSDSDLSNIELVFNTADVNYNIAPDMLRAINTDAFGVELPKGVYVFDFSAGGNFSNYGSPRDYVDTDKLSEFWIRFTSGKRGKVNIVSECIARLQG